MKVTPHKELYIKQLSPLGRAGGIWTTNCKRLSVGQKPYYLG